MDFGFEYSDRLLGRVFGAAVEQSDLVLVSGGSSTGPEDHGPGVVAALGTLVIHGVGLRPAAPSRLGFVKDVPVFLPPGNPVSCLFASDLFAGRAIRRLGGRPVAWPYQAVLRRLASKLISAMVRVDDTRVHLVSGTVEAIATSGASILVPVSTAWKLRARHCARHFSQRARLSRACAISALGGGSLGAGRPREAQEGIVSRPSLRRPWLMLTRSSCWTLSVVAEPLLDHPGGPCTSMSQPNSGAS